MGRRPEEGNDPKPHVAKRTLTARWSLEMVVKLVFRMALLILPTRIRRSST